MSLRSSRRSVAVQKVINRLCEERSDEAIPRNQTECKRLSRQEIYMSGCRKAALLPTPLRGRRPSGLSRMDPVGTTTGSF